MEAALNKLKEALKGTDTEAIKTATEEPDQGLLYRQREALSAGQSPRAAGLAPTWAARAFGRQAAEQPAAAEPIPDVVDADYTVVDDDSKQKRNPECSDAAEGQESSAVPRCMCAERRVRARLRPRSN